MGALPPGGGGGGGEPSGSSRGSTAASEFCGVCLVCVFASSIH